MTKHVALIACSRAKLPHAAQAKDLYTGTRFRLACGWASRHDVDEVFILSARHGLLRMEEVLEPYDESLANKSPLALRDWAWSVCRCLRESAAPITHITVLADGKYAEALRGLLPMLTDVSYPIAGMNEDEQKAFLAS